MLCRTLRPRAAIIRARCVETVGTDSGGVSDLYLEVAAGVTMFLVAGRYLEARAKRRSGASASLTLPLARSTAGEVKFSEAMSWSVVIWRSSSRSRRPKSSGSSALVEGSITTPHDLERIQDPRGNLTFVEGGGHIPFAISRVYWIYDVPGGAARGGHARSRSVEVRVGGPRTLTSPRGGGDFGGGFTQLHQGRLHVARQPRGPAGHRPGTARRPHGPRGPRHLRTRSLRGDRRTRPARR